MNYTKAMVLTISAMALSLLDTSFFSAMPIFGATLVSTFVLALLFSISSTQNILIFYSTVSVFFFSIFSSLPVWIIVVAFLILPYVLFFIRKRYFPKLSVISSLPFFMVGAAIFSVLLLVYGKGWNVDGAVISIYFTIINSALGVGLYYVLEKLERDFGRKEIKF